MLNKIAQLLVALVGCRALATTPALTLQGRMTDSQGAPIESATMEFRVVLLTPANQCILFDESQPLDMTGSSGLFAIAVNGGAQGTVRNDTNAWSFADAMSNRGAFTVAASNCLSGVGETYTPAIGDERKLKIYFKVNAQTPWDSLPVTTVTHSPYAVDSDRFGGLAPTNYLSFAKTDGTPVTTAPMTDTQYSALTNLVNGTSTLYAQPGSNASGTVIYSTPGSLASAQVGSMWLDTTSGNDVLKIETDSGVEQVALNSSGSFISSIVQGTGISVSTAAGAATISIANGGVGPAQLANGAVGSAALDPAITISTSGTVSAMGLGARALGLSNAQMSPNTISVSAPTAAFTNYGLILPSATPATGQVMAITDASSGQLGWISPSTGSVTSVAAAATSGNPIIVSGPASAPTIDMTKASASQNGYLSSTDYATFAAKITSVLASGTIFVGNSSNIATAVAPSGDVALTNTGDFTVTALQGVGIGSSQPTTSGQLLRFDAGSTKYQPSFLSMADIRSVAMPGLTIFPLTSCGPSQVLNWSSLVDQFTCTSISISAANVSGLGSAALLNVGTSANSIVELDGSAKLPAVDGSQLTNLNASAISGGVITALTGDVAASGSGTVIATIQPHAITTAKLFANPGVGRLVVTDSTDGSTLTAEACTPGQLLIWDTTAGWVCTAQSALSGGSSASAVNFTGSLVGDVTGTQGATVVSQVGGASASNVAAAATLTNAATSANTASTLVKRDASGNFAAGTITATGLSLNNSGSMVTLANPANSSYTLTVPAAVGTSGQVLSTTGSGYLTWSTPNSGSVTSVGLSLPSIFINPVSPVTSAGTLTATLASESAHQAFLGPTSGVAAPTFRNLNISDVLSSVSGNFLTGSSCTAGQALQYSSATDTISCQTVAASATSLSGIVPLANGGTGTATGSIAGTGELDLAAGGTNKNVVLTPSGTGYTVLNGNVGIGTTAPGASLDVVSNQGESLHVRDSSNATNPYFFYAAANRSGAGYVDIGGYQTGVGTVPLILNRNGGNVGVGITAPVATLDIRTAGLAASTEYSSGKFSESTTVKGIALNYFTNSAGTGVQEARIRSTGSIPLALGTTNNTQAIYILDGTGKVGVGTTAPSVTLDMNGKTDAVRLPAGTTAQEPSSPGSGMIRYNTSNNAIEFYNSSTAAWVTLGASSGSQTFAGNDTFSGDVSITGSGTGLAVTNAETIGTTLGVTGLTTLTGGFTSAGTAVVTNSTASTSTTTGAETIAGGLGVAGTVNAGILAAASGTAALPSHTFTSDLASGLWSPATSALALSTAGAERLRVTSTGNVGIGITNPADPLQLQPSANATNGFINISTGYSGPYFTGHESGVGYASANAIFNAITDNATGSSNYFFKGAAAGSLTSSIRADGLAYFAGSVGIGTTSPNSPLQIYSSSATTKFLKVGNVANPTTSASAGGIVVDINGGGGIYMGDSTNTIYGKYEAYAGQLGVGTITNNPVGFFANNQQYMTLTGAGNVGIGTSTPAYPLSVTGTSYHNGAAYFTGNVGIGTTSPGAKLDVNGAARLEGATSGYIGQQAAATTTSYSVTWPAAVASAAGQALVSDTSGNLSWATIATSGGSNTFADGGVSTPSVNFAGDTNTGLYDVSTGKLGLVAAGTQALTATSSIVNIPLTTASTSTTTGALTIGGGIGAAGNIYAGGIVAASSGTAALPSHTFTGDTASGLWSPSTSSLALSTAGTERMRINSSGNVGIGTTAPATALDVVGTVDVHPNGGTSGSLNLYSSNSSTLYLQASTASSAGYLNLFNGSGSSNVYLNTNGGSYFNGGNVGIGTTSPAQKLSVAGTIQSTSGGIMFPDGTTQATASSDAGTWTKSGTNVYYNGGNVGIGTTSPAAALQIGSGQLFVPNGSVSAPSYSFAGSPGSGFYIPGANDFRIANNGSDRLRSAGGVIYVPGNLSVGNESSVPLSAAGITGNISIGSSYSTVAAPANGMIVQGNVGLGTTAPSGTFDVEGSGGVILNAGNVGIGTTAPVSLMTLQESANTNVGAVVIQNVGAVASLRLWEDASNNARISSNGSEAQPLLINASGIGSVGVGTTAPTEHFDSVFSDSTTYASTSTSVAYPGSGGATVHIKNSSTTDGNGAYLRLDAVNTATTNNEGYFGAISTSGGYSPSIVIGARTGSTSYSEWMRINPSGNVGIGTTAPGYTLDVNGTARATAFVSTSDERLKKDVVPIEGLALIRRLNGVRFKWRANNEKDFGVIAQQVEAVIPEAVTTDSTTGYKAVKYSNLVGPLIESTKDLYGMCHAVEEDLARSKTAIDRRLASIEEENAKLKTQTTQQRQAIEQLRLQNESLRHRLEAIEKALIHQSQDSK